jgi:hypothetical protein
MRRVILLVVAALALVGSHAVRCVCRGARTSDQNGFVLQSCRKIGKR